MWLGESLCSISQRCCSFQTWFPELNETWRSPYKEAERGVFLWWTKYVVFISIWSINEACEIYFRFSGVGLNHKHLKPFWDTSSLLHVNELEFLCKQVPHRQWSPHLWPVIVLGGLITEPVLQLVGVAQTSVCFLGLNVMPDNGPFPSYNSNHYVGDYTLPWISPVLGQGIYTIIISYKGFQSHYK